MTFVEVHANEDELVLEKLIKDAYAAIWRQALPSVGFGRVIIWNGRMFQEWRFPNGAAFFSYEDRVLRCWKLPGDRGRMQIGSIRGEVFTTPPQAGDKLAARVKEGGRCGKEYMVTPFEYYDYHSDS